MNVKEIEISKIEQNENSRVVYKENDLRELMGSMKQDGLLQPIGVRVIEGGKFDCVFGNRRLMAASKLGWIKIPCQIMERTTEKERDVLNMIENIKRQNTTVAEDGRMFIKLQEHGLTIKEIAVRLGISDTRVELALEVVRDFPKEFHGSIVNSGSGKRAVAGRISASTAYHVNQIRRKNNLTRKQTRTILQYAKQDGVTTGQIASIGPLVAAGLSIQKAIGQVDKISTVSLNIFTTNEYIEKIERKHKKPLNEICYEILEKQLKVTRGSRASGMKAGEGYGTTQKENVARALQE